MAFYNRSFMRSVSPTLRYELGALVGGLMSALRSEETLSWRSLQEIDGQLSLANLVAAIATQPMTAIRIALGP